MSCDNFMFLLVRTYKDGQIEVLSASDDQEKIEREYLEYVKDNGNRYKSGEFRYDLYKLY